MTHHIPSVEEAVIAALRLSVLGPLIGLAVGAFASHVSLPGINIPSVRDFVNG